ncbi:MAG: glutamine amidotransferase [Ruminococcus sp.]|uniref:type 1 glutamine amidotransferase n=1 Tax=Ruminococcus sp. TaxID=41978 RepID=UPI0025D5E880|nr:glutamine amidotransferase [Ruminococcus sp.]MCR5540476.1 glutamine amidotransferase [Ruminococcus sp.]
MDKLKILHMYPAMLDLYGDSGNVEILSYRCRMRGIETEVFKHDLGDKNTGFSGVDIVYLGGGADFEQQLLADDLLGLKEEIRKAYESGVYFLMICGGYQLMGQYYKDSNGKKIPGLGLFDYYTVASTNKRERCIGNIVVETTLGDEKYKVIGFENHGGQTTNVTSPFGKVLAGNGNEFASSIEGYTEKNVTATYLHGPLLSKNPKLADHIISYCMTRKTGSTYTPAPINDKLEDECRKVLLERLLKK